MNSTLQRLEELYQFAKDEGITLPIPAEEIIRLEDLGFVIDLRTGQILEDVDPDEPIDYELATTRRKAA